MVMYSNLAQQPQSNDGNDIKSSKIKSFDEVPGPKIYPLIGSILELKELGLYDRFNKHSN